MSLKLVKWSQGVIWAFLFCSASAYGQVVGDTEIETIGNTLVREISAGDLAAALNIARGIDPAATGEIEQALAGDPPKLRVVNVWNFENGVLGAHDYNTIGVRGGMPLECIAATLLHEWEHVENCNGGPNDGGDIGDTRRTDPCYRCIHAAQAAQTQSQYDQLICNLADIEQWRRDSLCARRRDMYRVWAPLEGSCWYECPSAFFPYPIPCPLCD